MNMGIVIPDIQIFPRKTDKCRKYIVIWQYRQTRQLSPKVPNRLIIKHIMDLPSFNAKNTVDSIDCILLQRLRKDAAELIKPSA